MTVNPKNVLSAAADWNPAKTVVIQVSRNGKMYVAASHPGWKTLVERADKYVESLATS